MNKTELNLINKAIRVATIAHATQVRKGTDIPYITHPVACAMLAQNFTDDVEIIAACLLHDILEDVLPSIYNEQKMCEDFGDKIVELVKAVSEPKTAGEPEKPWKERKLAYFKNLAETEDKRAVFVSCVDKICNLNDILNDYAEIGEKIWDRFNADKSEQLWKYETCLAEVKPHVPAEMFAMFESLVNKLREIVTQSGQ